MQLQKEMKSANKNSQNLTCQHKMKEIIISKFTKFHMQLQKERRHRIKIQLVSYAITDKRSQRTKIHEISYAIKERKTTQI